MFALSTMLRNDPVCRSAATARRLGLRRGRRPLGLSHAVEDELDEQRHRADGEQAAQEEITLSTGLPALDAVLPGGGWPVGQLVEVLQTRPQQHVWRLLVPALAEVEGLVAPGDPLLAALAALRAMPVGGYAEPEADPPQAAAG